MHTRNLDYLFDFGDNWIFQINKTRHKDKVAQSEIKYPRVIRQKAKTRYNIQIGNLRKNK